MKITSYHRVLARTFLREHLTSTQANHLEDDLAKQFAIAEATAREDEQDLCIDDVRTVRDAFTEMIQRQPCNMATDKIRNRFREWLAKRMSPARPEPRAEQPAELPSESQVPK